MEYAKNSINDEYTATSTQFKMHCTEMIDEAKLAATSDIKAAMNQAATSKQAVALDDFEN